MRHALLAGAQRFLVLLAALAALTVGVTLLAALALGSSFSLAVPRGLYLVGCFLLLVGVFAGVRGPLRPKGGDEGRDSVGGLFGIGIFSQGIRTASADERRDARSTTWLFIALGVGLIVLGIGVDGRTALLG